MAGYYGGDISKQVKIGAERAAVSYTLYLLLGAIGLPVFAGMQGGFGVLAGPTGGYLLSFLQQLYRSSIIIAGLFDIYKIK